MNNSLPAYYSIITDVKTVDRAQLLALYVHEYESKNWHSLKTASSIDILLDKSCKIFIGILDNHYKNNAADAGEVESKLIGFGIISGDLNDPCIEDIIVHSNYRNQGLGAYIMNFLISHGDIQSAPRIELYCEYKLLEFYKKFGFNLIRGNTNERCLLRLIK